MATNFEGYSHQKLREMRASLDPTAVKDRADRLQKASEDIAKIAEKLKNHRVTGWEGEAATKFQEWVGRAGNATLRLSEYSATGAKWMGETVQKMIEARDMPAYDTKSAENLEAARKAHNDPDAQQIASQERSKLDADHRESIRLMNNLAQSYELSYGEMNKAEIPTFPPPPGDFVPPNVYESQDMARPGSGGSVGSASSSHSYTTASPEAPSNEPGSVQGHQPKADSTPPQTTVPTPLPGIPDRNVDVDLDHVGTLPPPTTTLPPTTGTPVPNLPVGPGPGPIAPLPPVGLPPITGKTVPGLGPGLGQLPSLGPGGNGLSKVNPIAGLPPRDSGIMGGRQVPTSGPNPGIPRGTVIGTEGTQTGRGMMGGPHGGGGHAGGVSGSPAARRLASEPGGIVGGRQAVAGGRMATGGQPFTQGGSGLVRNSGGAMGHAGAGTHAPGRRREDQGGERPDYLVEDEETWQGDRRVAPPVID
ncbi:WXG100 family type VII secretion target [Streptomyces sp. NPDC002209]|uniref:WXG100 family type VII secretion target n=1 Tax=Streptomyces sp. NPDC002209 TaxID=3364638 RepID=UPI0036AB6A0A